MCEVCHDTGFELIKNDAHYCKCDRGQRMQEAHRRGPEKKRPEKQEWKPRRTWGPGADDPAEW